jgi:hypothetical protein
LDILVKHLKVPCNSPGELNNKAFQSAQLQSLQQDIMVMLWMNLNPHLDVCSRVHHPDVDNANGWAQQLVVSANSG